MSRLGVLQNGGANRPSRLQTRGFKFPSWLSQATRTGGYLAVWLAIENDHRTTIGPSLISHGWTYVSGATHQLDFGAEYIVSQASMKQDFWAAVSSFHLLLHDISPLDFLLGQTLTTHVCHHVLPRGHYGVLRE